jgi:O-succinylbenzoate synthase
MDLFLHDLNISSFEYVSPSPFFKKKGLLLQWQDGYGQKFISDVCLLEGFSKESYEDILRQLSLIEKKQIKEEELAPSLHFALFHPLNVNDKVLPQTYQMLMQKSSMEEDIQRVKSFHTVKIKTKNFTTPELIDLTLKLHHQHVIRFDANRQLLDPLFIDFLLHHPECYDYIEEPLFHQKNAKNLKVALDETLYLKEPWPCSVNIQALIYKPTLCGGLSRLKDMLGKYPLILSSCYESSLGLKRIIKIQQTFLNDAKMAIGLDTMPIQDPFNFLVKNPPKIADSST